MHSYRVPPLRREDIRALTRTIRRNLHLDKVVRFPVLEYVEHVLALLDKNYEFQLVERDQLGSAHGETRREGNTVVIALREDIYVRAYDGEGRDRGTVAHEAGHYHLHARANVMARTFGQNVEKFEDPEWQAKCFQGELLVPRHLVRGFSLVDVVEQCGVSYDCAEYQMRLYGQGK